MHVHQHMDEVTVGLGFVLGALHALEPGHGKTAVLVHMLDGRMSRWAPLTLGLSIAASHSASLLVIAAGVHWLTHAFGGHAAESTITQSLQWASASLVVVVGIVMLVRAVRAEGESHSCGCGGHGHEHDHAHDHDEPADVPVDRGRSLKTSALLGLAIGLFPCPSALAAYLTGLSSGDPVQGYFVVVAFGLGIAASVASLGSGLYYLSRVTGRSLRVWEGHGNTWDITRAGVILAVGLLYTQHLIW